MCVNGSEDSVNVYNIKDYKLFSSYTVTTPSGQIDNNYHFSEMFITIYVNYPKLTIKQVYHFAHRLMNIVWGNLRNRSIQNIYLMKPIIIPNEDFEDCMDRVTLTKTNMNFKIDNTINTKAVLTYLKPLMEYFFGYEYLKVDPNTNEPYYTKLFQTQQITHR